MKFALGLLLAAVAVTDTFGETVTPSSGASTITGLGPVNTNGQNTVVQQAMQDLADKPNSNGNGNFNNVNPQTLPVENPATINGLGPMTPMQSQPGQNKQPNQQIQQNQQNQQSQQNKQQPISTNTLVIDPNQKPFDPSTLTGLGPQTPSTNNQHFDKPATPGGAPTPNKNQNTQTGGPPSMKDCNSDFPTDDEIDRMLDDFVNGDDPDVDHDDDHKTPKTSPVECPSGQDPNTKGKTPTEGEAKKLIDEFVNGTDSTCKNVPPHDLQMGDLPQEKIVELLTQFNKTINSTCSCVDNCDGPEQPVCGTDKITYSTPCRLAFAICQNPGSKIWLSSASACPKAI